MATTVTALVNAAEIKVDDLGRDDFLTMRVWMDTVNGFVAGPGNLVYEGADQKIIMSGLTAGVPYYFRVARVSEIDPSSVLTSAQLTATPTAPTVAAGLIIPGTIRGSNMFAGSFGTKGSTLTARVNGSEELLGSGPEIDFGFNVGAWINETGWTIGSGRANASALSNGFKMTRFPPNFQMVIGQTYTVKLDTPTRISGSLSVYQASGNTAIPNTNAVGVNRTVSFVATQTDFSIVSVGFEGSFDNVSLKFTTPATVVPVENTVDFPASGQATIFSSNFDTDLDVFTYTGKTANSLTGVTSLTTQEVVGSIVLPMTEAMIIDQKVNQMRFIGDRGDGVYEQLAAIGLLTSVFGQQIASFGSFNFSAGTPVEAKSGGLFPAGSFINSDSSATTIAGIFANGVYGYGVQATGGKRGVYGTATELNAAGVWAQGENTTKSTALKLRAAGNNAGSSDHAVHFSFDNLYDLDPASAQNLGDIYMRSDGRLVGCTNGGGTAWKAYLRDADTLLAASGNAAAPGVSFFNDLNTGMYRRGADQLGFSSGGIERMYLSSNDLNVVNSVNAGDGTAAAPTFTFITDTNSGMFRRGAEVLGWSTAGVEKMYLGDNLNVVNAVFAGLGSATDPSHSFIGDADTGMFRKTTNTLGFTTGGTECASVASGGNWLFGSAAETLVGTSGIRVGTTGSMTATNFLATRDITGNVTAQGSYVWATVQNDVTSIGYGYRTELSTEDALDSAFLIHYGAGFGSFGVGSNIDTHVGFNAGSDLIASGAGADRVYGFRGAVIANGVKAYNLYMSGTAPNFLQGDTEIVGTISGAGNIVRQGVITLNGASSALGFGAGAGGTSLQPTSKVTAAPALNKPTGLVTLNNSVLNAGGSATFTMANSVVNANDLIIVEHDATGTFGAYTVNGRAAAGQITFTVRNNSAANLSEAIVLRFAVFRSANS